MPHLVVTLCDGRTARIEPGGDVEAELRAFLEARGAYAQPWIKIGEDEYVRYDEIARVKIER